MPEIYNDRKYFLNLDKNFAKDEIYLNIVDLNRNIVSSILRIKKDGSLERFCVDKDIAFRAGIKLNDDYKIHIIENENIVVITPNSINENLFAPGIPNNEIPNECCYCGNTNLNIWKKNFFKKSKDYYDNMSTSYSTYDYINIIQPGIEYTLTYAYCPNCKKLIFLKKCNTKNEILEIDNDDIEILEKDLDIHIEKVQFVR